MGWVIRSGLLLEVGSQWDGLLVVGSGVYYKGRTLSSRSQGLIYNIGKSPRWRGGGGGGTKTHRKIFLGGMRIVNSIQFK